MSSFRGLDDKQGERLSGLGLTPMPRDGAPRDGVSREAVTRQPVLPPVTHSPLPSSPPPSSPLPSSAPPAPPSVTPPPVTPPSPVTPPPATLAPTGPSPLPQRETPPPVTLREAGEADGALRQAPPPIRDVASLSTSRPLMRPSAIQPSAIRPPVIPILGGPAGAMDASEPEAQDSAALASLSGDLALPTDTSAPTDDAAIEAPPSIGSDERRMHVRAYDFWAQLLKDRAFPTIADLEVATLGEFEDHAVLLDFTASTENPGVAYIGREIRESCGLTGPVAHLSDVPDGSLLSLLSDHYPRIVADEAPTSFEAESRNEAGANLFYRGILLPFSSDGDQIDVILGVLNWKETAGVAMAAALEQEVAVAAFTNPAPAVTAPVSAWAARPEMSEEAAVEEAAGDDEAGDVTVEAVGVDPAPVQSNADDANDVDASDVAADDDAGLAESLEAARATAVAARDADVRGRSALYRAISSAYDFSLSAEQHPQDYADLLADAGLKQQDRAPMTPVIKLIFGADYDKTRITEYATVIGHARAKKLGRGSLANYLAAYEGGLKALVKAERAAKRGQKPADATSERDMELLMHVLRTAPALGFLDYDAGNHEFILMVGRKMSDNEVGVLVPFKDQALLEKVLRKLAAS